MARKTGSHSQITGPRVREAALRLIARHGFAAVSMRQIAAEVGIQAGALYSYTPDKQTLLFNLMREHMDALLNDWAAVQKPEGGMAQLESFARFHMGYHLPRPDLVFISYMELRNLSPENFAVIEQLRKTYETEVELILKRGQEDGSIATQDAKITSLAIIAILTGVSTLYRQDGRLPETAVADLYWDLVRKSVAP
jgi:AcrR family transcriptional regulator